MGVCVICDCFCTFCVQRDWCEAACRLGSSAAAKICCGSDDCVLCVVIGMCVAIE